MIDPENKVILVYDFANKKPVKEYSFTDTIPIAISGGACESDFEKIDRAVMKYGYR